MSIEIMRQRIITFIDKECGTGAAEEEIVGAESALGVTFPESYRRFLQEFGWARFSHQELYGLGCDVPIHLELRRNTDAERNQMRPRLTWSLVPIMNNGAGDHYCLDTSSIVKGECPVVFWNHELGENQEPDYVSLSFHLWLVDLLAELAEPAT